MKLSYDVFNAPGDIPPIIFMHGLGDSRSTWRKVAPEIARNTKRQAFVVDALNHGDSPRSTNLDYNVLTQDLEGFMDDLGIKSAVIVGHSMGGRTAINFALKHPNRTEALVVEDMTPRNVKSTSGSFVFQAVSAVVDFLKNIPLELTLEEGKIYLRDLLINLCGDRFLDQEKMRKMADVEFFPINKTADSFALIADAESLLSMLRRNALVQNLPESGLKYSGDSLFLYGSLPFFNLGKDDSIKKLFPRAVLKKIQGSSHYIHIDNPHAFVEEVSNFILNRNAQRSKI